MSIDFKTVVPQGLELLGSALTAIVVTASVLGGDNFDYGCDGY